MFKRTSILVLASLISAGALVGCTSTSEQGTERSTGAMVDDSVITGRVKAALVADPTTKAHQIEVETFQGRVQLSGFVENEEARSRATGIAKNIEGVKDVTNSLQLRERS